MKNMKFTKSIVTFIKANPFIIISKYNFIKGVLLSYFLLFYKNHSGKKSRLFLPFFISIYQKIINYYVFNF